MKQRTNERTAPGEPMPDPEVLDLQDVAYRIGEPFFVERLVDELPERFGVWDECHFQYLERRLLELCRQGWIQARRIGNKIEFSVTKKLLTWGQRRDTITE